MLRQRNLKAGLCSGLIVWTNAAASMANDDSRDFQDGDSKTRKKIDLKFIPDDNVSKKNNSKSSTAALTEASFLKALHSKLPDPSQRSLDQILEKTNRVRVYDGGEIKGKPLGKELLLDTQKSAVLQSLKDSLKIIEDPEFYARDLCLGDPCIELLHDKKPLAVLGFHHGRAIRFSKAWKFDGTLVNGRRLTNWFADNGIEGPLQSFERELRQKRRADADLQKWSASMPECFRNYWTDVLAGGTNMLIFSPEPSPTDALRAGVEMSSNQTLDRLLSVLKEDLGDTEICALVLLQWYACGSGPWTGYPSYEELPAQLLLQIPTKTIVQALQRKDVSEAELNGAARFFASHIFRSTKPQDLNLLDEHLKQTLLSIVLKSDDEDQQKRARLAFSSTQTLGDASNGD